MSGLPKLPGFSFRDPTQTKFNLQHTFDLCNGYKLPKTNYCGIGGKELATNTVKYLANRDPVRFDPSLTYGRTKSPALPQFTPHYVLYDQKCLTFRAFFKQSVEESPQEFCRIRYVNIIYFLEDDTITVMEPKIPNSGMDQGRLIRRGKIPKNSKGDFWHWKDLNVGKDFAFYGKVFHTVDCDVFTKEYMASQGIIMGDTERMPIDRYNQNKQIQSHTTKTPPADDKLRRFLEYDGKILKFKAVWDDRENEHGELRNYEILYFLSDDTVSVKEVHEKNDGRDPYPVLLRKTKLPKRYTDTPVTYPAIYLELSDAEVTEYYQPKDLLIGETIFVLGRDMLLYDCDQFTRDYFKNALCIEQKPPIPIQEKKPPPPPPQVPPHNGIGSLEDSLQNTLTVLPKPPKKDVMRQILNANKYLRYEMVMDVVHPEDAIRRFILSYSLADGTCRIIEPPIRNSGILGGKYLRSTYLIKPGSDPLNPDYYTAADFYIGAIITVFQQRFKIIGADLYVYRYMQANAGKFPCEVIENMRNYMFNKGYLKDDVEDTIQDNLDNERKWDLDTHDEPRVTEMEKCLKELKVGEGDTGYDKAKRAELVQQYEESIKRTPHEVPYGIKDINMTCAYPVHIGEIKSAECKEDDEGIFLTPSLSVVHSKAH
ncbi:EF-hand domain-containing protein 1-like isoform X2 [Anoplophora glabripennis]|uniref:EF-hand domain-containing protein 1-like isoform X2 n=1 Tax=Anoplophora glabripennis TaxID=217634 RepID=UPI000873738C|nr:EF-hand domain-containing protein 1-like isoform X2 [Anoplophora glabripennis]